MKQIRDMTLREKIGQLFVIRPDALEGITSAVGVMDTGEAGAAALSPRARAAYGRYPCGGFALFRQNIEDPAQLKALTQALRGLDPDLPPLLFVDEEGGNVARLGNHPRFDVPRFPPMEQIARTGDPERAYRAGAQIGAYLREYGFDADFAPVADVNTNPLNPIIGSRAFGDDPETAGAMAAAFVRGLHSEGIMATLKHFPGHGDTKTDSHTGYAETEKTLEELTGCELIPFAEGIRAGAELIMTAHIAAPRVTGDHVPATMSPMILTDLLRGRMGYRGVIVTDALEMGAITEKYTSAEACVACLRAGADILLMPLDYQEAFEGVLKAAEDGGIGEERIDESLRRIASLRK